MICTFHVIIRNSPRRLEILGKSPFPEDTSVLHQSIIGATTRQWSSNTLHSLTMLAGRDGTLQECARTWRMAKLEPMQPWRPPPKPMKENGAALSSSRGGTKRSGSKLSGSRNTCGSRCANAGDVATTWPCMQQQHALLSSFQEKKILHYLRKNTLLGMH